MSFFWLLAIQDSYAQNQDTTSTENNAPYKPSKWPTYKQKDRFADPFTEKAGSSPLLFNDITTTEVEMDDSLNFTIKEKMGDLDYRPSTTMSYEEFEKNRQSEMISTYWKLRSKGLEGDSTVGGRGIIPPIALSPIFDRIFGGNYAEITPSGFVTLDFGARFQRVDNPSVPVRQQRNGGFEFDQQISMNVVGTIGEKLKITANFDNNNSFDFENNLKIEYSAFEEDIIQDIEIGNVSMPINNSLISGAQNLFGIKSQLRFGKLWVTAVASTQRGTSETLEIENGAQGREFEIRASDYDDNRHFFLGHFFRDNYENSLSTIPNISSGANITRIEVYVINRSNDTETNRNFTALMDLGEANVIANENITASGGLISPYGNSSFPTDNDANNLFSTISGLNKDAGEINKQLGDLLGMESTIDYETVTSASKLDDSEFTYDPKLGYISLLRKLQNDEVLAVSYQYTVGRQTYQVGELSEDYANRPEDEVIFLKLLKPSQIRLETNTWDLMMKNIYNLNASRVEKNSFQLKIIYRDDKTGQDNPSLHEGGPNVQDVPLIRLVGLDKLNTNGDFQFDGNFDFVEGITINTDAGHIIFPTVQPFGGTLEENFDATDQKSIDKFVYNELYTSTKADAELLRTKNKYFINGRFQSGSSSEIILPGINIAENSVRVWAGNRLLVEGTDYTVSYGFSPSVRLNESILLSGDKIRVTYEKADLFSFQTRNLLGSHFDYRFNEDFNVGATFLYLNERPLISRVSIGNEPLRNVKIGTDLNYRTESRLLTKIVDALPLVSTKEKSTFSINAEFAQLFPGTSNKVQGEGTSYIDDFESSAVPFSLASSITNWKLASTPSIPENQIFNGDVDDLSYGYKRAKMAWYVIDNSFYRNGGNIDFNEDTLELIRENHYSRSIAPQEVYPGRQNQALTLNLNVFDVAYFPRERGPYNFSPNFTNFNQNPPEENWGGITRAILSDVDFDRTNIEYIEFWMMDPFVDVVKDGVYNKVNENGGKLVFNLGNVSEDIMNDGRNAFESGLPADGDTSSTTSTTWGRVTNEQYLYDGFNNANDASRANQDIGLDGLAGSEEASFFYEGAPVPNDVDESDASVDDFQYYFGDNVFGQPIPQRYKNFNGTDGNTPILDNDLSFSPSGSTFADKEDLNVDNRVSELEGYYEYEIDIRPDELEVGNNFIVDQVNNNIDGDDVTWYLYRIPIKEAGVRRGDIEGFKSIRFVRMYMTGFRDPVVLRFADLQVVGSQWRRFTDDLSNEILKEGPSEGSSNTNFTVTTVNIEGNGQGTEDQTAYVLPPGINRDRDNTSTVNRQLNEQSIQLCIEDLEDGDARAVYKNVVLDLINYGSIKMFIHAEENSADNTSISEDELTGFIRFGTDFDENYYEIEVPLKITPGGAIIDTEIWPAQNEINVPLNELFALKATRNREGKNIDFVYSGTYNQYNLYVRGNPDLSSVQTIMIGVRNPILPNDDALPKSVCIWANELRVTDFNTSAGWAANTRINTQLADLMNVNASTRYTSFGFGGIQDRISERTREETVSYDASINLNADKFGPDRLGIKVPMLVSYSNEQVTPMFDPFDPDTPLEASLLSINDPVERSNYEDITSEKTVRRSLNFTNVKKEKRKEDAKPHPYDIENWSFTYAYSDQNRATPQIETYETRTIKYATSYNYSTGSALNFAPFGASKSLSSKYLKLIKDINVTPVPNNFSFRADLDRSFIKTQIRDLDNIGTGINDIEPQFEKLFTFRRTYNLRWDLTKSLSLDYSATANAVIDEPPGEIDTDFNRDSIWVNIKKFGRMKEFMQNTNANYKLPLDKLPITNWTTANLKYGTSYTWTAGPITKDSTGNIVPNEFGNTIQNNRTRGFNGKVDFLKLYNKSKFLKSINRPRRRRRAPTRKKPEQDSTKTEPKDLKLLKNTIRAAMLLRSVNFTYNVTEGTSLPGFSKGVHLFGMDSDFDAPGLPFLLGSQSTSIKDEAELNSWLVRNPNMTNPFSQFNKKDLSLRANIEPFKDLKIQLDAKKTETNNYQEIFAVESINGTDFQSFSPSRSGNYNISYMIIQTAMVKDIDNNVSPVFQDFESYRSIIRSRLSTENNVGGNYQLNSQDVLIPAFVAAYSGKDPNSINLSPFPKSPIPNWRVDYAGLGKIKSLRAIFSSISLNHSYSSSYDVGNYTNSLDYVDDPDNVSLLSLNNRLENYPLASRTNGDGDYIPYYVITNVTVSEQFSPLIGINVRTKSKLTTRLEYKTSRDLSLILSNAQVTEQKSKDFVIDVGYTKAGMKLPMKIQGRTETLKNDVTFRLSFTVRDTKTIQRKFSDDGTPNSGDNTITNGNVNFQLNPTISYVVNEKLNLQIYFERTINEPKVSRSFKTATTRFGVQLRFSLAQ